MTEYNIFDALSEIISDDNNTIFSDYLSDCLNDDYNNNTELLENNNNPSSIIIYNENENNNNNNNDNNNDKQLNTNKFKTFISFVFNVFTKFKNHVINCNLNSFFKRIKFF